MREQMAIEYSYLADGDTLGGQLCPACKGGGSGEHSMSISRRGGSLLWKCHRSSCGFSGYRVSKEAGAISYHGGGTKVPTTKGVVGRIYYKEAAKLPEEIMEALSTKYYLNKRQLSLLGWDEDTKRVALPVFNAESEVLGCVLRSEQGDMPKALSYTEESAVALFRNPSSTNLIIVEDIYSALRASEYMNAVAILGTYLNPERVDTLAYLRCKKNYLALDADAYDKTIKYVREYRTQLPMIPVKIEKDLKNMDHDELKETLSERANY